MNNPARRAAPEDVRPQYGPAARRPIARAFRRTADLAVRFCVRQGIHPDVVSYSSIVAAALAAAWQAGKAPGGHDGLWLLLPAAAFCYLRLWLNFVAMGLPAR